MEGSSRSRGQSLIMKNIIALHRVQRINNFLTIFLIIEMV